MLLRDTPHRRRNALTGEWVLVSPHREKRPWRGQVEATPPAGNVRYDPGCYLCPGNARAAGVRNPSYASTYVFENDFPALLPDAAEEELNDDGLLVAASERGVCRVVCFSPDHSLTLSRMSESAIRIVVDTWADQYRELMSRPEIRCVQIFENRGEMMGASNPHPHGQIWACEHLPDEWSKEQAAQEAYPRGCLLCDYLAIELQRGERLVCRNADWVALVPFWAVWPFETLVLPVRHTTELPDLSPGGRDSLASLLRRLTAGYDALFDAPFPYSMGFHQQPGERTHLHAHFYPPLLRSATVRKFMVGFEMLGGPQRDLTPENAAARLRAVTR
ncbi:MAG: UDP-glucose--hexose-1-phosphate uridylyltransferase [Bryobacterales bacterium]|nr:UDP-glucose--hexose-1-phosphate uridylyltransferase [Bryobacterales bacterium]